MITLTELERKSQLQLKRIEIEDRQEYNIRLKNATLQNYCGLILHYYKDFKQTAKYFEKNCNYQVFNKLILELNKRIYTDIINNSLSWEKYRHSSYKKRVLSIFTNKELSGIDTIHELDEILMKYDYFTLLNSIDFINLFNNDTNYKHHIGINLNGLYCLALAYNRVLYINNHCDTISGDIGLIINNLLDSKIVNDLEIIEKVYPIYKEIEIEDGNAISKVEFNVLYHLFKKKKNQTQLDIIHKTYEEQIDKYYNIVKEIKNNIILLQEVKQFIFELDFLSCFEIDFTSESSAIASYSTAIEMIIYPLLKTSPIRLFYELLSDDFIYELATVAYKRDRKEILEKEKKRLISGNLNIEISQYKKRMEYESITNGYDFEVYLGSIFKEIGYTVSVTKKSGDQGADLIIEKNKIKTVVQAKFYSSPVGNKAIQEVVSAIAYYGAKNGMVVTNNSYTKSAIELAIVNNIELIDGVELKNLRDKLLINI